MWTLKHTTCWFNLNGQNQIQSPTVRSFTDAEMDEIKNIFLKLSYPCQNQAVKRHVKVATKTSAMVVEFDRKN